jgi:hypothetical protein
LCSSAAESKSKLSSSTTSSSYLLCSSAAESSRARVNMASLTESEVLYKLGAQLFLFRVPQTTTLTHFHSSLKSSINSPECESLVKSVSDARVAMHMALYTVANATKEVGVAQLEQTIAKVDAYLPLLQRFISTLTKPADTPIKLDREFSFEWKGTFGSGNEFFQSSNFYFELIMVLFTKAVLHQNVALVRLKLDSINLLSEAGKSCLLSSSIMSTLASSIMGGTFGKVGTFLYLF